MKTHLVLGPTLLLLFGFAQSQELQKTPQVKAESATKSEEATKQEQRRSRNPKALPTAPQSNYTQDVCRGDCDQASEYWTVFGYRARVTDWLLSLFTFCLVAVGAVPR